MPVYRTNYKVKSNTGRPLNVGGDSLVNLLDSDGFAKKKLAIMSGQSIQSGSQSLPIDIAGSGVTLGHSDAADGANFEIRSPTTGETRNLHVQQVSKSYASTLNNGTIDITNADILALVTAYNTATGKDFVLVSARYTSEG